MESKEINELLMNGQNSQQKGETTDVSLTKKNNKFLFFCDALNDSEINNVIKGTRPELITLFGFNDVGKTTFIGSLFHILCSGNEIGGYTFVDSETFIGFEDKVYNRRCNMLGESNQPRTGRTENAFLTIKLVEGDTSNEREVVFSDRAGELYRDYKKNPELLVKDKTLTRSNRILIFIDASMLKGRSYSNMKDDLQTLYKQLSDNDKIPQGARKYLVFNKFDKVINAHEDLFINHKNIVTRLVKDTFGADNFEEFCINSSNCHDAELNKLVQELIQPLTSSNGVNSELDWVNNGIKENK